MKVGKGRSQPEIAAEFRLLNPVHGSGDRPFEYQVLIATQVATTSTIVARLLSAAAAADRKAFGCQGVTSLDRHLGVAQNERGRANRRL